MTNPAGPIPVVLAQGQLPSTEVASLASGVGVAAPLAAIFDVTGPGAVPCVQGLVTNDIEAPGDTACVYGAVLTPKGMIRTDLWVWRIAGRIRLVAPREGHDALLDVLTRTLPPRLARFSDGTNTTGVFRLVGPGALDATAGAGLPVPDPGRVVSVGEADHAVLIARPPAGPAPFALDIAADEGGTDVLAALERAGARRVNPEVLDLARITAGWPRLGAEIDDKTLPQEVRFDENGGVSYKKGCYTGQETVARLHFRGHANRGLVGLIWDRPPDLGRPDVVQDEKSLGQVTSAAWLETRGCWIGLAKVRRELDRARSVDAAGAPAVVADLPIAVS